MSFHDAEYVTIKSLDNSQYYYRGKFFDDPSVDLAIIEVSNSAGHACLPVRKTVPVEGQNIVVIGNPEGEMGTVTTGIVSANRGAFFLFSAPISPGSSGSPILDEEGYVVGVVKGSRKDTQSQNMNLAVAASNINVGNESPDSPVTENTPPVDEVPSAALRATPNPTPDSTWPDGRILTHPEHFVSAVAIKVKPTDTLKLRNCEAGLELDLMLSRRYLLMPVIFQRLTKTKSGTVIPGGGRWNGGASAVTSVGATFRPSTDDGCNDVSERTSRLVGRFAQGTQWLGLLPALGRRAAQVRDGFHGNIATLIRPKACGQTRLSG